MIFGRVEIGSGERRGRIGLYWRKLAAQRRAWRPLAALALALVAAACNTVPVTGRRAFNLFSESDDMQLGLTAYQEVLAEEHVIAAGPEAQMVERVMQRLAAVAEDPGFEWEVKLLDASDTVNAFCLPGGKMCVYTGILPIAQGEAGLAVVMGHEIAHAVARHGTERLSQSTAAELVLAAASPQLEKHQELAGLLLAGYQLGSLGWGRKQESEADHIGLIYMARAGYDPREAVRFWERMSALGGSGVPEWLSTHPSDETRASNIEALMPEAMEEYERARAGG
jgi:predicted Zn-dependent protease